MVLKIIYSPLFDFSIFPVSNGDTIEAVVSINKYIKLSNV